jgi:hypothetical protein
MRAYFYSGAYIAPREAGFDVFLTKTHWIHRDTLRQAKWAATVYKNLAPYTLEEQYASTT